MVSLKKPKDGRSKQGKGSSASSKSNALKSKNRLRKQSLCKPTEDIAATRILDDDIYLGAENNFNLFIVRNNSEGATDEEWGRLEVVGVYHLGEFVNWFQHGILVMCLPNSDVGQIPTVIFGTVNGVIGVIASLPHEQYLFREASIKLEEGDKGCWRVEPRAVEAI